MNNTGNDISSLNKVPKRTLDIVNQSLSKRYQAEQRFRRYGLGAII